MRIQTPLLLAAIFAIMCFSGCGRQQSVESTEESQPYEPPEQIVMEPPQENWTLQQLMSVTYICDHRLSHPQSMNALGDDFSLSHYSKLGASWHLVPAQLCYRGQGLANVTVVKPHDETMIYSFVLLPSTVEVTDREPFVINGIKMYDTMEDVEAALGENYLYKSDDSISYGEKVGGNEYWFFFEEGKLVHLNLDFSFDIDLPLYQKN